MIKANFTVEFENEFLLYKFEQALKSMVTIKDITVIPDTKELYDNDPNFRQLCKTLKECKKIHSDYINNNNF